MDDFIPHSHGNPQLIYVISYTGRHTRILAEISSLDADIVTMQEIEYDYYHNHIKAAMWNLGYTGVHHLRCVKPFIQVSFSSHLRIAALFIGTIVMNMT